MKKQRDSIIVTMTLLVATSILSNHLMSTKDEKFSNLNLLFMANVEALSSGGDSEGTIRSCCKNIKYDDYSGKPYSVVYCGNCDVVPVTAAWNEDTCRK